MCSLWGMRLATGSAKPPVAGGGRARVWRFAGREFDEAKLELRVEGVPVELEFKPLELLLQLLVHANEVVTKEQLLQDVWSGLSVADGSLSTAIHKLRKALRDDDSRLIVTVPRVGYRLAITPEVSPLIASAPVAVPQNAAEPPRRLGRRLAIAVVALVLVTTAATFLLRRKPVAASSVPPLRNIAVLPFQNAGTDHSVDFLSVAIPDEIATALSYAHPLTVRPFAESSRYNSANLDLHKVALELNADGVITGHFIRTRDGIELTLEAIDTTTQRILFRDTLVTPPGLLQMREALLARTEGPLVAALGGHSFSAGPRPNNVEAYELYLRAGAIPLDVGRNKSAVAMLERSVELDPNFAPAWLMLGRRYYIEGRYGNGGVRMAERAVGAIAHSAALDRDYLPGVAFLVGMYVETGDLQSAFQQLEDLVERHPDSVDAHYNLSYALRYAGLLDDAATECDTAYALDPRMRTYALLRSCGLTFALVGNYSRALLFLQLDPAADFTRAMRMTTLLRAGQSQAALKVGAPNIPQWKTFDMLPACIEGRPQKEIAEMARAVEPSADPEANYLAAANLAYCGQDRAALDLLTRAIDGNYCSYPAMDSDPLFDRLRSSAQFVALRAKGIACRQKYLPEHDRIHHQK